MASATPVRTFLQVSDLHFGELDANGDAQHYPGIPAIVHFLPHFDGLLGHRFRALCHLHDFYWKLKGQGEDPQLIVTGDLTRTGNGNEFDVANDYLVSQLVHGNKRIGLRANNWRALAISGNHDKWPGNFMIVGGPTPAYLTYFPAGTFPFDFSLPLPDGRTMRLLGIDTDFNVHPYSTERICAQGCFDSQLNSLQLKLGGPNANEVRVLLLHHSPAHQDFTLSIVPHCLQQLADFVEKYDIRILLTGHLHAALFANSTLQPNGLQPVFESRCGTTTQMDVVPAHWLIAMMGSNTPRRRCYNSLIVHRLSENNGAVTWSSQVYVRRLIGFQPAGRSLNIQI